MGLFSLCRLIFLVYNYPIFSNYPAGVLLSTFLFGLRFDASTVLYLNAVFFLLHILPLPWRNHAVYQKVLLILFITANAFGIMFELGDTAYFKFSHKRLTSDFFSVLTDFGEQLFSYLATFWYLVIVFVVLIYFLARVYRRFAMPALVRSQRLWVQFLLMFPLLGLFVIGARGGLQLRPISPITALQYVDAPLSPMVFNTCFSIGTSYQMKGLEEKHYFADKAAMETLFTQTKCYAQDSVPMLKKNVVVIILESFSKYFVQSVSHEKVAYTPFLDSLIRTGQCYISDDGFANARHSNEGSAAILASIPSLMVDPFMTSVYQNNTVTSFAGMLKNHGYHTAYFHGANNGSMTLDLFTRSCGFDAYYGRNEYPNPDDYDGHWGIYDEKFLGFFADKLHEAPQPFATALFTLSSHFPYQMPPEYEQVFPKVPGEDPMFRMVRYTDHSLKLFFDRVKNEPWYSNTLFVFTADHTFGELSSNTTFLSKFSIPIFFFDAGDTQHKKKINFPVQQVDIIPSIMDYLHVPDTFRCFGHSVFNTSEPHFAYHHEQGFYELVEDHALLQFDGTREIGFYDLLKDPMQRTNRMGGDDPREQKLLQRLEAVIQTYNHAMIANKLH